MSFAAPSPPPAGSAYGGNYGPGTGGGSQYPNQANYNVGADPAYGGYGGYGAGGYPSNASYGSTSGPAAMYSSAQGGAYPPQGGAYAPQGGYNDNMQGAYGQPYSGYDMNNVNGAEYGYGMYPAPNAGAEPMPSDGSWSPPLSARSTYSDDSGMTTASNVTAASSNVGGYPYDAYPTQQAQSGPPQNQVGQMMPAPNPYAAPLPNQWGSTQQFASNPPPPVWP
jgi:hypothetical protein